MVKRRARITATVAPKGSMSTKGLDEAFRARAGEKGQSHGMPRAYRRAHTSRRKSGSRIKPHRVRMVKAHQHGPAGYLYVYLYVFGPTGQKTGPITSQIMRNNSYCHESSS